MNSPAPFTTPVLVPAIPWYKSPQYATALIIIVGAALSFFPKLREVLKQNNISAVDLVEIIGAALTLVGGGIVWVVRQLNKTQPITFSQKGADQHPNTIAVAETQAAMRSAGIPTGAEKAADIVQARQDANNSSSSLSGVNKP